MSRLDELIEALCPDGVEYKPLGEICEIANNGVDKKIVERQKEVALLNYMDVYRNQYIGKEILSMKVTADRNKIDNCNIEKGDIFITPTSETIDDIGYSSVAVESLVDSCFSYHIMRLRLKNKSMITSFYLNYLFRSANVQKQILKLATGLTRFGMSKGNWVKIQIPLPPLPVQEEIVRILDNFTELTAELTAELTVELTARKKQYEYYRDSLFTFEDGHVEWKHLKDVALDFGRGKSKHRPRNDSKLYGGLIPFIQTGDIRGASHTITHFTQTYSEFGLEQSKLWPKGTLCITIAANIAETAILGFDSCFPDSVIGFVANPKKTNSAYVEYLLTSYKSKLQSKSTGGAQENINLATFDSLQLPFPSITEQQRIVDILDRFDTLCNDISSGLPAEIKARQQQYEYYRDKLLTFKQKEA